jgi:hypothetical protein
MGLHSIWGILFQMGPSNFGPQKREPLRCGSFSGQNQRDCWTDALNSGLERRWVRDSEKVGQPRSERMSASTAEIDRKFDGVICGSGIVSLNSAST